MVLKNTICIALFGLILLNYSCKNNDDVDVSGVNIEVDFSHLAKDFFNIDTTSLTTELEKIRNKHPNAYDDFLNKLLGLNGLSNKEKQDDILHYYRSYKQIFDSLQHSFADFSIIENKIVLALKYFSYYFPDYKIPDIVYVVTPFDALLNTNYGITSEILTDSFLFVSLLFHAGSDFSYYHSGQFMYQYPKYIRQTFTQENIPLSIIKLLLDDKYPEPKSSQALIYQMINKGKRLYLLSKLLPFEKPYHLIGYSKEKYDFSLKQESYLWGHLNSNNLLFSKDPNIIRQYIGIAPYSTRLSKAFPGNIGSFIGWKIVESYLKNNTLKQPKEILNIADNIILTKSKYKP